MQAPTIRAPRGSTLSCKGWQQEAALRMLMNNLDPEVAEDPQRLVVYGGTGKAARSWPDYHRIVASLRELGDDETLIVQSGRAQGIFKTTRTRRGCCWPTACWSPSGRRSPSISASKLWASPCSAR